jgi:LacI family transcriptional regulator
LLAPNAYSEEGGYAAAISLLRSRSERDATRSSRPEALYVATDVQAVGALYACFELGLRVPEDVAIVAHDGTRAASWTTPPLTSLRQDLQYVAQLAAAHTLERIESPSTPLLRVRLRGNLVVAQSCGCELVAPQ